MSPQRREFLAALGAAAVGWGAASTVLGHHKTGHAQDAVSCEPEPTGVHHPPADIDATGGQDVAAALTAWLATVPDGETADLNGGTYRCETHVRADDRADLTIRNGTLLRTDVEGHGGIVYPKPNPHLWLFRPTGCRVENLKVRGTNTVADQRQGFGAYKRDYEFEAAVRVEHFTDCTVVGLAADGIWGDGIQWQAGTGAYTADARIDRVGRQGVTVICSDFLAERVRVEHGRRSGFDFEPDITSQVCEGIEVRDSYTNTIGLAFASAGRGQVNDVWLHHNTSEGPSVPVLHVRASDGSRRHSWRFEDHRALSALGSPTPAVLFGSVDDLAVRRVRLPVAANQGRIALGLASCGGVCEFTDNDTAPGGDRYFNRTPMPGQQLVIEQNTMPLTEVA